jgi:glycerol-3-phosphate acyltransferase PlsX
MVRIALDGLGGDNAPAAIVEGTVRAVQENPGMFTVILTGPQDLLKRELEKQQYSGDRIEIVHAPEQIGMGESPTDALKSKPNSSLVTCVGLQKKGLVHASMSAGNSGAMMASCLMLLGRIQGVNRPAIACDVPSANKKIVLLDCGANVDEKPQTLVHFGVCGSVYAEHVLGYATPKVGLLNMGEEEKKGTEVLQETYQLLKKAPLNFVGNIEGRDIVNGTVDVIVTPGYTGNVVLKLMEGFFELHQNTFGTIDSDAGKKFSEDWNYSNEGGALLLGLNGTGLITHGRADALAIKNGLVRACKLVKNKVAERIAEKVEAL